MKGRSKICHVLAAAGKEESIQLLRQILRGVSGSGQLRLLQAATLEQIRRGVSGVGAQSPADLLIAVMPLSDGTGVEGIIDVAQRHPQLMTILRIMSTSTAPIPLGNTRYSGEDAQPRLRFALAADWITAVGPFFALPGVGE